MESNTPPPQLPTSPSLKSPSTGPAATTRLERSSSLTWGLNWDRNAIFPAVATQPQQQQQNETFSSSRMMRAFSADDSMLLDSSLFLPPQQQPQQQFSLHQHHRDAFSTMQPPMSPQQQQRQRATSDAAAVKAAWGADSPASPYTSMPNIRRTHSAAEHQHHIWDNTTGGPFSPTCQPNTTTRKQQQFSGQNRTQSVGSPSWSQLEDEDVYAFDPNASDDHFAASTPRFAMSPMQHRMFPGTAAPPLAAAAPPPADVVPQSPLKRAQLPPNAASAPVFVPNATQPHADEQVMMYEAQLQNLQHMQQQWIQMVQMQLDHTIYTTEQRFAQMSMSSPPQPSAAAVQQQFSPIPPPIMYRSTFQQPSSPSVAAVSPRRSNQTASTAATTAANASSSSSLLSEHKVTGRHPTAQELIGHVVEFSRDAHGSRLIQLKMETGTKEEKAQYVNEALPHTLALARDMFGNYVVQNFFDNADTLEQRDALATALLGNVNQLCTHPHGCRVVQRALFAVSAGKRNDLIQELIEIVPTAAGGGWEPSATTEQLVRSHARDAHATHVVQKAVCALQRGLGIRASFRDMELAPEQCDSAREASRTRTFLEIIETCALHDVLGMATHQQACRFVQKILASCEHPVSQRVKSILHVVLTNIYMLAVHQNGNFVLQHLLECTGPQFSAKVQQFVCMNGVKLAKHKFGSHLVEKALSCATEQQINCIIDRFLLPLNADDADAATTVQDDLAMGLQPNTLPVLMKDPYANFVVQKAFDVSSGDMRARLGQEIRARTASLSKFSYGRHILTHINRVSAS